MKCEYLNQIFVFYLRAHISCCPQCYVLKKVSLHSIFPDGMTEMRSIDIRSRWSVRVAELVVSQRRLSSSQVLRNPGIKNANYNNKPLITLAHVVDYGVCHETSAATKHIKTDKFSTFETDPECLVAGCYLLVAGKEA